MPGFTIPNVPDSDKTSTDQSEPDRRDFEALGDRRRAVVYNDTNTALNLAVSPSSGLVLSVQGGEIFLNGTYYSLSSATYTVTLESAGSANRFDLIVARANVGAGTASLTYIKGQADATNPVFPAVTDTDVWLAAVYVAAGNNTVSANNIIDKRTFIMSTTARVGAGVPSGTVGRLGDMYVSTATITDVGRSNLYVKTGASTWENVAEYPGYPSHNITVSTSTPSGGTSGDIWVKVV